MKTTVACSWQAMSRNGFSSSHPSMSIQRRGVECRDLNSGPLPCQGSIFQLIYTPIWVLTQFCDRYTDDKHSQTNTYEEDVQAINMEERPGLSLIRLSLTKNHTFQKVQWKKLRTLSGVLDVFRLWVADRFSLEWLEVTDDRLGMP